MANTTKKKVIFVNSIPPAIFGGGEKWFYVLAEQLSRKNYQIGLIARPGSRLVDRFKNFACDIFPLKFGCDFNPISIIKVYFYFREFKPDVLFLNLNKDVSIAGLAGRLAGVPKIIFRNGYPIIHNKWQHRILSPFYDKIIVNSNALLRYYSSFDWDLASKINVIYNGIEIQGSRLTANFSHHSEKPFVILGAGRFSEVKRYDLFIKIIAQLRNEFPINAVLAGEGDEFENLKLLSRSLNASVEFIGQVDSLLPYWKKTDVFLHTSRNEGMPNVILEAMAAGVPVVASNSGGTSEIISDGENGFLCQIDDHQKLYEKVKLLLERPDLRKKFSLAGIETVRNKFSLDRTIQQVEQLIQD